MSKETPHDDGGKGKRKKPSASSRKKRSNVVSMATRKAVAPASPDVRTSGKAEDESKAAGDRDEKGKFQKGNSKGWKKGESGNPKGRPKLLTLSEAYRNHLATVCEEDAEGRTYAELIAERQVMVAMGMSLENSSAAAKELCDRTEGKPKQHLELDVKREAAQMLAAFLGVTIENLPKPAA